MEGTYVLHLERTAEPHGALEGTIKTIKNAFVPRRARPQSVVVYARPTERGSTPSQQTQVYYM